MGCRSIIGWDEARFAVQGYSIASTGRDLNGHRTPLFFHNTDPLIANNSSRMWWQPVLIYLIAAVLRFAPLSEWSVRLPIAALAILNVWLIYAVARRLFSNAWYAVLAALMLALTPAHLIFGRMATDYFCPCLSRCCGCGACCAAFRPTVAGCRQPPASSSASGCTRTSLRGSSCRSISRSRTWCSGFSGKPLRAHVDARHWIRGAAAALWFPGSGCIRDAAATSSATTRSNTSLNLAERVALYWDYFNPSYLFFSGGSDLMWATRRAGVFVLAVAVLLPCGIWSIWRRNPSIARTLLLVGFFFAPVPIVLALPEAPQVRHRARSARRAVWRADQRRRRRVARRRARTRRAGSSRRS